MSTKHTPTPWKVKGGLHIEKPPSGPQHDRDPEQPVALVYTKELTSDALKTAKANADFIVSACNSHDDLLAMCKELKDIIGCIPDDTGGLRIERLTRSFGEAVELIAKAEGKA